MKIKHIIFQFLAGLFLMLGSKQLYVLGNIELLELISSMGKESFAYFANKSDRFGISSALQKLIIFKIVLGFVAIGISYIILFVMAYKKRWNWNIPLIISIVLGIIHYLNWIQLSPISLFSKQLMIAYLLPVIVSFGLSGLFYWLSFRTTSK
ncbi:hypothetical protein [Faecalibacter sp. LW9]|uniref:hypothetical protein n=1 Tax=Faecalibacter sp. LW9 TaxID=3103144 RepID=UPI002AFDF470|nr:hypothetical protein [Faecalibacter sp. LW9]